MNKRKTKSSNTVETAKIIRSIRLTLFIFFLVSIFLSLTFLIKDKLENFLNFSYNQNALSTVIQQDGLIIHFIDVGQADATLIEFPNNEIMLIDCGDDSTSSQEKFRAYLNKINFEIEGNEKVINYLILTHPDSDHIGGAEYIFNNFKVKNCYRPDVYASNEEIPENTELIVQLTTGTTAEMYANIITKINEEEGCLSIKTVQELEISSPTYNEETSQNNPLDWIINFYAPVVSELPYRTSNDFQRPITNDYSPIMILSYLDKKIMFTGDASENVEKAFIEYYENEDIDFDIDFLKVGHHGSRYSTCEELLTFVDPEYAIISVGVNSYEHPSSYTLDRLTTYGLSNYDIYRTDLNGNIIAGISQTGELSLTATYTQYSTLRIQWWAVYLVLEGILLIILFIPYFPKLKIKKENK